jgi:hypothetical protein
MDRFASSLVLALIVGAAASCSGDGGRSTTDGVGCSPGQQVECACPGSDVDGVQICHPTGIGFGECMGCGDGTGDGSSTGATSNDDSATAATTATTAMTTTPMDTSGPGADESEVTGPPGGSESGGGGFAWVWVDHGGPAFLPPPCAAAAGVAGGLLVDPQAFFNALVAGADPNDWEAVMNAIEPELWACGVGQQRDSGGNVRGRLFLPTDACPNAAPPADDAMAMFLGVRQERACWTHFVDIVAEL